MRRRLVVLSAILVNAGLGCPGTITGTKGPVPDLDNPDPDDGAEDCAEGCEDPACWSLARCGGAVAEWCDNGVDDDADGWIDCDDTTCWSAAVCTPEPDEPEPEPEPEPDAQPVGCGNGILDGVEECDDGNLVSDDGCDAWCRIEVQEDDLGDEGDQRPVQDVTAGESVDGGIDPVGDEDWYRIRLADGDRLIVETSDGEGSCAVDTVVQLFGATRPDPPAVSTSCEDETDDLMCDDDGGPDMCSLLDDTATEDGFVHVRIFAFGHGETGDYRVTFTVVAAGERDAEDDAEPNDSPEEATAIVTGDVVEGEIDPADDEDYFTFEVRAFETLRFETSDGQGGCNFDSVLTLYDELEEPAEGTTCLDDLDAFACDDDDGNGTCSTLEHFFWLDDTILARVISFGHLSTGTYVMSVTIQ